MRVAASTPDHGNCLRVRNQFRSEAPQSGLADMLALAFGAVSLLYSTVGQAGGTGFLAVMAFASFPTAEMRPTALLLNVIAAAYASWHLERGKHIPWRTLTPLLFASLPTAFIGGSVVLGDRVYHLITGLVLIAASAIPLLSPGRPAEQQKAV